jgi:hypothetical protein
LILTLFDCRLRSRTRSAAVLADELDTGALKRSSNGSNHLSRHFSPLALEVDDR